MFAALLAMAVAAPSPVASPEPAPAPQVYYGGYPAYGYAAPTVYYGWFISIAEFCYLDRLHWNELKKMDNVDMLWFRFMYFFLRFCFSFYCLTV